MKVEDVLEFWLGPLDEDGAATKEFSQRWYKKSDAFDASIRERFLEVYEVIAAGDSPDGWDDSPKARLARIIILDQFTRNMFRGSGRMYEGDALALQLSRSLVADLPSLGTHAAAFALMPLMHAENVGAQDECSQLFGTLASDEERCEAARGTFADNHRFARSHGEVIARFGRFPHRNALLGRENTPEEESYLQDPKAGW